MENMNKMILAAIVALVMGQTVVAHEGCNVPAVVETVVESTETAQAPVATPVEEVKTEEETVTAPVTDADVTNDVVATEDDSQVEDLLNQIESEPTKTK